MSVCCRVDTVILGTKKEAHRSDLEITDEDRKDIWERYLKLHPTFKGAEFVSEWSGIRPARPTVRLEHCVLNSSEPSGNACHVIHNYGHGQYLSTLCQIAICFHVTMAIDQLVESIETYHKRHISSHAYATPFLVIYTTWILYWNFGLGTEHYWEIGCIVTGALVMLQVLTMLFCYWFVSVHCWLNCHKVKDPRSASYAKVVPRPNNGWTELAPLNKTKLPNGTTQLWFSFQKALYTFDDDTRRFQALEFDTNRPMKYFQEYKGIEKEEVVLETKLEYGKQVS
uniref:P5A-ATPase transmembrane helical hairpin domain-containing protein n=1 Tax=Ditylenchus dipsaci TaxID=166011 RepID=A0A915EM07_9BILA